MIIPLDEIIRAKDVLKNVIYRTKLINSKKISSLCGNNVYFKCENLQKTGSFKIRGAYNRIANLNGDQKGNGVIASSAGNHAQGVALGASAYGISSTIVMPLGAPVAKVTATQEYGAKVVLHGNVYDEAYEKALDIQRKTGATFIHPFNDPYVIAGQGTIGLEILEDLQSIDAIVIPIGGGGLIAGIAIAAKELNPKVKIIGVEPEQAASMSTSIKAGEVYTLTSAKSIADGIAVKTPGDLTFEIVKNYVDEIVMVSENEIANAIQILLEYEKMVAEGAGAASIAALIYDKIGLKDKNIVSLISGGNIDMNMLTTIIDNCLLKDGRMTEIKVTIPDKPGNLKYLLELVAKTKANIYSISQTRMKPYVSIGSQEVTMVLETKDHIHIEEIHDILKKNGYGIFNH